MIHLKYQAIFATKMKISKKFVFCNVYKLTFNIYFFLSEKEQKELNKFAGYYTMKQSK